MARYHIVETKIWDDPDFRMLPAAGKIIVKWLFNNKSMTASGIYPMSLTDIADYTGVSLVETEKILRTRPGCFKNIEYDWENGVVFVVNHLRYSGGTGGRPDLHLRSIARDMQTIHTTLWQKFVHYYPDIARKIRDELKIEVAAIEIKEKIKVKSATIRKPASIEKATAPDAESIYRILKFTPSYLHDNLKANLDREFPDGHEFEKAKQLLADRTARK